MKIWEKLFIVGIIVAVALVVVSQQIVAPQTVVTRSEMLEFSYVNGEVRGIVRYFISLDATGAQIDLHNFADNISVPYADLVRNGLPAGTTLDATKRASVYFSPAGVPWVYGAVDRKGIVYSDGHQTTPINRDWSYYQVSQWLGQNVPYRVRVTGDIVSADKTFLAGPLGLDVGQTINIGQGIKFTQTGFLGSGRLPPSTDYAQIWTSTTATKFVGGSEVSAAYSAVGPMGRGPIQLVIQNADGVGMDTGSDSTDYGYVMGRYIGNARDGYDANSARNAEYGWIGWDYLWTDIRNQDGQGAVQLAYKGWDDWACSVDVDMDVTFGLTGNSWFNPEVAMVATTNGSIANVCDLPTTIDLRGKTNFDLDIHNISFPYGKWFVEGYITVDLINATDAWAEFINRTRMGALSARTPYGFTWALSSSDIPLKPASVGLWTSKPSWVGSMVPPTNKQSGPYTEATSLYAVLLQSSGDLGHPTIILDVPASMFDFDVVMPNYGNPQIVEVETLTAESGYAATYKVKVKNLGPARDGFVARITGLPPEITVYASPNTFIEVGDTKWLQFSIAGGLGYEDMQGTSTVTVTASGSGLFDSKTIVWRFEGQERPPETGSLIVTVMDRRTEMPVEGAIVRLGDAEQTTGNDGSTTFTNLLEGTYTVTARNPQTGDEGSTTAPVVAGVNTCEIWLGAPSVWDTIMEILPYVIGMVVAVVVVVVVYKIYKRRKP